nr:wall-associated receptor kinase-like 15 [Quercus suber]
MDQIYEEEMDLGDCSGILVSGEMRVTHVSEAYNTCPKCGSIDVPYPLSTDDNCGDPSSEGLKLDENLPFNISTPNTVMLFNCTEPLYYWALNCSSTSFCRQFENNVEEGIGLTHVSEAYNTCPKCGSIDVPYPLSTDDNCGDPSSEGLKLDENLPFNISTPNTVMLFNCTEPLYYWALNCSSTSFCRQFENNVEEGIGCKNTLCCHYLKDSPFTSHMIRI